MKQLKFMLAAATAIGLAAAAQAALTTNTTGFVSQDFDDIGETDVPNSEISALSVFSYDGDPQDNESKIVVKSGTDLALSVNTSTNPILCTVQNSGAAYDLADADKAGYQLYIDTMVQFTVTPAGDIVTNTPADKLMIYLQEVLETKNEAGETVPPSTNLMVKATKYIPANGRFDAKFEPVDGDVKLLGITVLPGEWYRLVVEVSKCQDQGVQFAQFRIKMAKDGEQLVTLTNDRGLVNNDNTLFPSLQGKFDQVNNSDATTIQYVGFAGEGKVDDIVVAEVFEAPDVVAFTFAINYGSGVKAVQWTIDDTPQQNLSATVNEGQTIAITDVTYDDWYVADGDYRKDWSMVAASATASITVGAKQISSGAGAFEVEEGQTPPTATEVAEALKITNPEFKGNNEAAQAMLTKGLNWAKAYSYTPTKLNDIEFVGNDPKGVAAEAYLLNCAATQEAINKAMEDFVLTGFSIGANGAMTFGVGEAAKGNGSDYANGKIEVRGKATLDVSNWVKDCPGAAFFKAFLVK